MREQRANRGGEERGEKESRAGSTLSAHSPACPRPRLLPMVPKCHPCFIPHTGRGRHCRQTSPQDGDVSFQFLPAGCDHASNGSGPRVRARRAAGGLPLSPMGQPCPQLPILLHVSAGQDFKGLRTRDPSQQWCVHFPFLGSYGASCPTGPHASVSGHREAGPSESTAVNSLPNEYPD